MRATIRCLEFWVKLVCEMVRGADCYDFDDDVEWEEEYDDWRQTLDCKQEGTDLQWHDWIDCLEEGSEGSDGLDLEIDEDVEAEMYS
jgi:hypothetical protein